MQRLWTLGLTTALLWALAAGGAVYWGLRMAGTSAIAVAGTAPALASGDAASRQASIGRLLGAQPAAAAGPGPAPSARFSLAGVIASLAGDGAALIAVDGKPARPFAVGSEIAPGYTLKALGPREALLSENMDAPVKMTLSLPMRPAGPSGGLPISSLPVSDPRGITFAPPSAAPPALPPPAVVTAPVSPPVTAASAPASASAAPLPAGSEGGASGRPHGPTPQVRD